jgi:outer membrane lipoprotein-sorting protein
MIRFLSSPVFAAALLAGTPCVVLAEQNNPSAAELVSRVRQALNPPRASSRDIEVRTETPGAKPVIWHGRQLRKPVGGESRVLTLLTDPPSVADFAILISESSSSNDTTWMYVPPVHRVRRIEYGGRYENFLGTDLSAGDFGFLRFDPSMKVVGKATVGGADCWEIDETPQKIPGGYSRIRTWITVDNNLPIRREYYDEAGKLWKVDTREMITVVEGVPVPMLLTSSNVQEGGKTTLKFSNVDFDVALDDSAFTREALAHTEQAGTPSASATR